MSKNLLMAVLILTTSLNGYKKTQQTQTLGTNPATPTVFKGKGGIYYRGTDDIPINNVAFANTDLAGT